MNSEAVREFLQKGYTTMDIPGSHALATAAAMGFEEFLNDVPLKQREHWTFNHPTNEDPDGSPDDGFIPRNGEDRKVLGGKYDAKQLFHYRPRLEQMLADAQVNCSRQRVWFLACQALFEICSQRAQALIKELDRNFPGHNFARQFDGAGDLHVLRIIQYAQRGVEDPVIVGKKHPDRNFLTLQIAESQPGLRIYPDGESHPAVPYEAIPGRVLAFPSKKFEIATNLRVKALYHDIVNKNPEAPPRWSVIFFSHIILK